MSSFIWIKLLEGTENLVKVRTRHVKDDLYEIIDNNYMDLENDATSIWEFFPGDIVKCVEVGAK